MLDPVTVARKAAKTAVLPLGLPGRRPEDLVILLYHRVGEGSREVDVGARAFERQMAALSLRENVLTIDDALRPGAPGGVAVTFDDGFRDFREHALPALVRHGIPAVLYLTTGWVREEMRPRAGERNLSWADLRDALATGLVTVGAHTHSHPQLSRSGEREAEQEMRRSKELIEDRLGVECRHFAYPYSKVSPAADRVARRLFGSAALAWGTNRAGRTDLHRLGRVPVLRSDGPFLFRAKVGGFLDREALVYRLLRRGPWRQS